MVNKMGIHWEGVDIAMALIGGALISISTILHLYVAGRITGISRMLFVVSRFKTSEGAVWRYSFLTGLIGICYLTYLTIGEYILIGDYKYYVLDPNAVGAKGLDITGWCVGAFLVGVGTHLGNGCTSGHGVCGLPRLSIRSLLAVCLFIAAGVAVATLRHYVPFFQNTQEFGVAYYDIFRVVANLMMMGLLLGWAAFAVYSLAKKEGFEKYDPLITFAIGVLFGIGLLLSGMCRRSKIIAFLTIKDGWDPSLMFVMAAAVGINLPAFQYLLKNQTPLGACRYSVPTNTKIDWELVAGAVLFGVGWGVCGFCPGPGLANLLILDHGIFLLIFMVIGQLVSYYGKIPFESIKEVTYEQEMRTLLVNEKKSN